MVTGKTPGTDPVTAFVIIAPKSLDMNTTASFRDQLREAVTRNAAVAVDLETVEFMDTWGLACLIGALRMARAHDCEFTVVCTREPILRLFRVTTMDRILDVRASLEECNA